MLHITVVFLVKKNLLGAAAHEKSQHQCSDRTWWWSQGSCCRCPCCFWEVLPPASVSRRRLSCNVWKKNGKTVLCHLIFFFFLPRSMAVEWNLHFLFICDLFRSRVTQSFSHGLSTHSGFDMRMWVAGMSEMGLGDPLTWFGRQHGFAKYCPAVAAERKSSRSEMGIKWIIMHFHETKLALACL